MAIYALEYVEMSCMFLQELNSSYSSSSWTNSVHLKLKLLFGLGCVKLRHLQNAWTWQCSNAWTLQSTLHFLRNGLTGERLNHLVSNFRGFPCTSGIFPSNLVFALSLGNDFCNEADVTHIVAKFHWGLKECPNNLHNLNAFHGFSKSAKHPHISSMMFNMVNIFCIQRICILSNCHNMIYDIYIYIYIIAVSLFCFFVLFVSVFFAVSLFCFFASVFSFLLLCCDLFLDFLAPPAS